MAAHQEEVSGDQSSSVGTETRTRAGKPAREEPARAGPAPVCSRDACSSSSLGPYCKGPSKAWIPEHRGASGHRPSAEANVTAPWGPLKTRELLMARLQRAAPGTTESRAGAGRAGMPVPSKSLKTYLEPGGHPAREAPQPCLGWERSGVCHCGPDGSSIWSSPEESGHKCGAVLPDTAAGGGPGTVRRRGCVRSQALAHSSALTPRVAGRRGRGSGGPGGRRLLQEAQLWRGWGSGWSYQVPITRGKGEPHPLTARGGHRGEAVQYDLYKERTGPGFVPGCMRGQAACSSCISLGGEVASG